jgi:steroid 5-alpha reductase family enzyme
MTVALFWALLVHIHFWFFVSLIRRRNDVADTAWGLGFALIAWVVFSSNPDLQINTRITVVLSLVSLWAVRLSVHLYFRTLKSSVEDPRYQAMRQSWGAKWLWHSYFKVYWLQTLMMLVVSLPLLSVLGRPSAVDLTVIDMISLFVAVLGLTIEAVADRQKQAFKKNPLNRGRLVDVGLWSRARHPNYFGEMLFWWGLAGFSLSFGWAAWWAFLGPVFLTFLLLKVSGVPLLEAHDSKKPGYREHKKRTQLLIPIRFRKN